LILKLTVPCTVFVVTFKVTVFQNSPLTIECSTPAFHASVPWVKNAAVLCVPLCCVPCHSTRS